MPEPGLAPVTIADRRAVSRAVPAGADSPRSPHTPSEDGSGMFKLLRKHNKWILAVGGSLLMVVFLLPQALEQFGANPRKATVALVGDESLTEQARIDAQRELAILDSISPGITAAILQVGASPDGAESGLSDALHWLLLTREAGRQRLIGGAQDGRGFIPVAARFFAQQYILQNRFSLDFNRLPEIQQQATQSYIAQMEEARSAFINRSRTPPVMVDRTLAKARGVLRMYEAYLAFDPPSLQESLDLCREFFNTAEIVYYIADSEPYIDEDYQPDETEILVHYSNHKENLPDEGQHGFGYRAEDRVKLEWLRITRFEIADAYRVDPVEANRRWRNNRNTYPGEFAEELENVSEDIREERTDTIVRETEQLVRAELLKARGDLTQNDEGMYDLPPDWAETRPSLLEIAQVVGERLREKYGPDMPNPTAMDDSRTWRTRAMTRGIPIVGSSSRLIGPRQVRMAELAFSTPEIDPDAPFPVQAGVTQGPLFNDRSGDVIFFRVLEAQPSAPLPLDEVRDQVIDDIRALRAYEALKAEAPRMITDVLTLGAEAAAEKRNATLFTGVKVTRDTVEPIDPSAGPPRFEIQKINNETFRDAVMDRVETYSIDTPIDRLSDRDLLLRIPLDDRMEVAITGIQNVIPLTIEAHRMIESEALQFARSRSEYIGALQAWPYSASRMQERHNVRVIRSDEDTEYEDGDEEVTPPEDSEVAIQSE